jgi:endoglucanase
MSLVNYNVVDNWGAGFIGNITISGGETGLQGWTLAFDAGFDIGNIWGAEIVSREGNHYKLRSLSWNADVPPGQSITIGFQATPGADGTAATGLALNGETVAPEPEPAPQPALSVEDASAAEGDEGIGHLAFTVRLSEAAQTPVSVNYATLDGSARAGLDYTAASGVFTFAPGETVGTIYVPVHGDTQYEPDETLTLQLASADGAIIGTGSAAGTILNDDDAPVPADLPVLSIADTSVVEGNPGTATGPAAAGWLSTAGNQIVDAQGNAVQTSRSRGSRDRTSPPIWKPCSTKPGASSIARRSRRSISASSAPSWSTPRMRRGSTPSPPILPAISTTTAFRTFRRATRA